MAGNLRNVSKRKDVSGIICVAELDENMDIEQMLKEPGYLAKHAKVENTFTSIEELKLFYHDKPARGKLTDRQRWRVLACVFDGMLFLVQLLQLCQQIADGKSWWFTATAMLVIAVCTAFMISNTIRDWGD